MANQNKNLGAVLAVAGVIVGCAITVPSGVALVLLGLLIFAAGRIEQDRQ